MPDMAKFDRFSILVLLLLAPALGGCEFLGLDDDDQGPPPVIEVPEAPGLVIPEPIATQPVIEVLHFAGLNNNDPLNPVDNLFSFLTTRQSVLNQGSGLAVRALGTRIPLGQDRYTSGYAVIFSNERFFLARPDNDTLAQLSTFNGSICGRPGYRILHRGIGPGNSFLIAHTPGEDLLCDSSDDRFIEISLEAEASDPFGLANEVAFRGLPIVDENRDLVVLLTTADGDLAIHDAQGIAIGSTAQRGSLAETSPIEWGEYRLFRTGNELYIAPAAQLADGFSSTPLIFNSSVASAAYTRTDDAVFLADGSRILRIDPVTNTSTEVLDLTGTSSVIDQIQVSDTTMWISADGGKLLRIELETGESTLLVEDRRGPVLATAAGVYVNSRLADDTFVARFLPPGSSEAPACAGEGGRTQDDPGCWKFAEWFFADQLTANGEKFLAVLREGQTSIRTENRVEITVPAQVGEFLNAAIHTAWSFETGTALIRLGIIPTLSKIDQTGVVEDGKGLLRVFQRADETAPETGPDLYYYDAGRSVSLRAIRRTPQVDELLLSPSRLDFSVLTRPSAE